MAALIIFNRLDDKRLREDGLVTLDYNKFSRVKIQFEKFAPREINPLYGDCN